MFSKIRLYTLLTQGISAIFTDKMPNFNALKAKVFPSMQATIFSTVCHFVLKYLE